MLVPVVLRILDVIKLLSLLLQNIFKPINRLMFARRGVLAIMVPSVVFDVLFNLLQSVLKSPCLLGIRVGIALPHTFVLIPVAIIHASHLVWALLLVTVRLPFAFILGRTPIHVIDSVLNRHLPLLQGRGLILRWPRS